MSCNRIQKAFIWAAGLGTRLRPYTDVTPKPLLPVCGRPLIEYILRFLRLAGIRDITVNTWHLADQFEFLPDLGRELELTITLSRQRQRYEHAGDLAQAHALLHSLEPDERFIALNGDTLFHLPPEELHSAAESVSAQSPLLIFAHKSKSNPLKTCGQELVGIGQTSYKAHVEPAESWDDFGIKIFHASIVEFLPEEPHTFSLHGSSGLIAALYRSEKSVLVRAIDDARRAEIGTVQDYEGHAHNRDITELASLLSDS